MKRRRGIWLFAAGLAGVVCGFEWIATRRPGSGPDSIVRALLPIYAVMLLIIAVLIFVPDVVLLLPRIFS